MLGMSTEVKGCRRDWNDGKSSKPVSAGKNSRTFGLRGQHLKPCDKGLCPFFSSSKPYTSNCTCEEESTQLPVQPQSLCQWHHTVPVAWVPPWQSRRGLSAQPAHAPPRLCPWRVRRALHTPLQAGGKPSWDLGGCHGEKCS